MLHLMKITALLAFALSASFAFAAEEKKAAPAAASEPAKPAEPANTATPTSTDAKVYAPTDLATLKPLKGQKVVIEGTIASSGANKADTIRYLNFTKNFRESVSLVFFGSKVPKEKLSEYVGKKVRVSGTL